MATGFKKVSDKYSHYIVFDQQGYDDAVKDYADSSFYFNQGSYPISVSGRVREFPALVKFSQSPVAPDCLDSDCIPLSVLKAAIAECPED